jgi:hypothetical protein
MKFFAFNSNSLSKSAKALLLGIHLFSLREFVDILYKALIFLSLKLANSIGEVIPLL